MQPSSSSRINVRAERAASTGGVYALFDARRIDDEQLLRALAAAHPRAPGALFERFAAHVERVLVRILGSDADVGELVNETFFRALERVDRVDDARGVRAWLTAIAVNVAREHLRARRRRGWLRFFDRAELPDPPSPCASPETAEAVRRLYAALAKMPEDERIALALRFVEGMELTEVADACSVSLATVKRLLARAEARFVALSKRDDVLRGWLEGGGRWSSR